MAIIAAMFVFGMFVICLAISSCKNEIPKTEKSQTDTIASSDALDSLISEIKNDTITKSK